MIGPNKLIYEASSDDQSENSHFEDPDVKQVEKQKPMKGGQSFYQLGIPVDQFTTLQGHKKAVACIAVQPKGHRMATGGLDYHVRLWDFHGMNKEHKSFRIIEPFTGNAIRNLCYNTTGTHLMIINGNKQITFLDKEGGRNLLTVKGYPYVKDLNLTKGHTNTVYDGMFHPTNSSEFVTCSGDGSIRLWDFQQKLESIEQQLAHKSMIRCKDEKGYTTGITGVSYANNSNMVFGGCQDGSLQGFNFKTKIHRPDILVRSAHQKGQDYTTIASFPDGQKILTRNTDDTLKIWDLRNMKEPVLHYSHLPNYFPGSKVCFSPDQRYFAVGTSIGSKVYEKESYLHFFDSTTFEKIKTMSMGSSSVTGVTWSKPLNQIFVGLGNGQAQIYFDQRMSVNGALKSINKKPRVDKDPKSDYSAPVYNPHSLPMYKEKVTNNPNKEKVLLSKDPIKTAKPFLPVQGPFKGGKRGDVAYNIIQDVVQRLNFNPEKVEDERKPLWQIQKWAKDRQQYTAAYQHNQPEAANQLIRDTPNELKQLKFLQTIQKICPHCGLKLCTCIRKQFYDEEDQSSEEEVKK